MHNNRITATLIALSMTTLPAWCDDLAAIKQALTAKYALTTTTADKSDIVTAGCVLVLKKSNLVTTDATKMSFVGNNTYKNGRITQGKFGLPTHGIGGMGKIDGTRTFVSGEKVWLTGIDVTEKDVVFNIFTDAYSDVRYKATLKFPFEKDSTPTTNSVLAAVAEVFDIQASDANNNNGGGQQQQPQQQGAPVALSKPGATPAAAAPAEAAPPPIAPPPPPPADPKEIKLGQTPDQVTANIGQPDKVIKLGAKQIYVYKDMKIVFMNGKVSDVQ